MDTSQYSFFTPLSYETVAEIISKQEQTLSSIGKGKFAIYYDKADRI